MSAWNPGQLSQMALPPCHLLCQFQVTSDNKLNCLMYQRSCDMVLGVPFNIASYSLLTCLIAQVTGLKPGEFVHTMGDMHVYNDHIEPLKEIDQLVPFPFPEIEINPNIKDIDSFKYEDIKLKGYKSHPKIAMKMSV